MANKTPSAGALRAANEIMHYAVSDVLGGRYGERELAQYLNYETCEPLAHLYKNTPDTKWTIDGLGEYIDRETGAQEMAKAIEKLLDYDRRNGAMNFQYEKWLDHLHNLKVVLDKYQNG